MAPTSNLQDVPPDGAAISREVSLPTSKPPFSGYFGADRCTLVPDLPLRELGYEAPIFQCHAESFHLLADDGSLQPMELRVDGVVVTPRSLHATKGRWDQPSAWVGTTRLRAAGDERGGLERWTPSASPLPEFVPYGSGLEGRVVGLSRHGDVLYALTNDAVYRGVRASASAAHAFERVLALADLPGPPNQPIAGAFCGLAASGEREVLLTVNNYGRRELWLLGGGAPVRLTVPPAPPRPPPADNGAVPGPPGGGVPSGPPGGGQAAPRRHQAIAIGGRVFVGSADEQLLMLQPDGRLHVLALDPRPGPNAMLSFSRLASAAGERTALFAIDGRVYACELASRRCVSHATPGRQYVHVEHMASNRFVVLHRTDMTPNGGASIIDAAALLASRQ